MATYLGTPYDDIFNGSLSQDFMYGYGGRDILRGDHGNDIIDGGSGNDLIEGGLGSDILTGGTGYDIFRYYTEAETSGDTIKDFKWWENDTIDLLRIDAKTFELFNPSTWGNEAFTYKGYISPGQGLQKGELGFQYIGSNTYVYGNTDGDGTYEVALTVNGNIPFISTDFFV